MEAVAVHPFIEHVALFQDLDFDEEKALVACGPGDFLGGEATGHQVVQDL